MNRGWLGQAIVILIIVGQEPTVLAVGAGGGYLDIFSLTNHTSFLSPFYWKTALYRLKYCLNGVLIQNNEPINHEYRQ